jgi:Spy/CpxP family protein refolding chaperone
MKKIVGFFAAVVFVAGLAAVLTLRWSERRADAVSEVAAHRWLHQELQLTPEQHKALEPIEAKFAEQQRSLVEKLRLAKAQLARAMAEDKAYTPRVTAEVEMVHHCMGDLQKASIEHVFEMRTVLTPAQSEKLLSLAQQALEEAP